MAAQAAKVKAKHDKIASDATKREVQRTAAESQLQAAQRSHVVTTNWARQLALTAAFDKRLPEVPPDVAKEFSAAAARSGGGSLQRSM